MQSRDSKTCLSYWFPLLEAANISVLKTRIVNTDCKLLHLADGQIPEGFQAFLGELRSAIAEVGGTPCFLRTGLTSGKHGWKDTCFVADMDNLASHVQEIVEFSFLVDLFGLPVQVWAVRELLKVEPAFHAFHGMLPITKERRYFVLYGKVVHHQPYWDPAAIADHTEEPDWREKLAILNAEPDEEVAELTALSQKVNQAIPGFWSVDWLWTSDRGWVCIDMAEGEKSYRWQP